MTDPITKQLAEALRKCTSFNWTNRCQVCHGFMEHTPKCQAMVSLAAFDAAKNAQDAQDAEIAALKNDLERAPRCQPFPDYLKGG